MDPADNAAQSLGSVLSPLLISMAAVVASSLVLVAYHLLIVKYCMRRRGFQEDATNPSISILNGGFATGVEHRILETIPILSFSREKVKEFRTDQTECVVCLGEVEEGDTVRLLPNCRHIFHVPCIENWFLEHSSCPVCRTPVVVTTDSTIASPLGDDGGERLQDLPQSSEQDRDQGPFTSGVQSNTPLRHCVSLVFPTETKPKHLITGLKRSLPLDQSYILINIIDESGKAAAAASSSSSTSNMILTKSNSFKARSMRQLHRMSSLLRAFSQLRTGRSSATTGILPY